MDSPGGNPLESSRFKIIISGRIKLELFRERGLTEGNSTKATLVKSRSSTFTWSSTFTREMRIKFIGVGSHNAYKTRDAFFGRVNLHHVS